MDARHRDVLIAIIREYIDTAEPVGSRVLSKRHFPHLSPATLRNVMADLEENGYLVQFRALNQGGSAAAELTIEGELTGAEGELELSEVVLDYLPPRSGREGGLVFAQDPRAGRLTLRAKSYAKP